ncbi:MAG: hypothetical protein H6818_19120 [Phycisphaerales bacterium]|nr:hypothetical protein [Phycisphaerales bacterium]MCB9863861.1 hypothetical protein [Phycisphaerales bacterium]
MEQDHQPIDPPTNDAPVGHCPHCDYQLLQPGTCPECGKDIAALHIRSLPRLTRRRRAIFRTTAAALLLAVVVAGRWAIRNGYQYRLYTNSMLIDQYPGNFKSDNELARRIGLQRLALEELDIVIDKSIELDISLRTPRPPDVPLTFHYLMNLRPGAFFCWSAKDQPEWASIVWTVDDVRIEPAIRSDDTTSFGGRPTQFRGTFETNATLGAGPHQLHAALTIRPIPFRSNLTSIMPLLQSRTFTLSRQAAFDIQDRPICEFIDCRDTPDDIEALRRLIRLNVRQDSAGDVAPDVCAEAHNTKLQLKGEIELIGESHTTDSMDIHIPAASAPMTQHWTWITDPKRFDHGTFRLRMDEASAFEGDADVFYPFTLEWRIDMTPFHTPPVGEVSLPRPDIMPPTARLADAVIPIDD